MGHQAHAPHEHDHEHQDEHERHGLTGDEWAGMAEVLDLDAQVLHGYHAEVMAWVAAAGGGSRRVLDVGAGTGAGTLALLEQFTGSEVVALDVSRQMLDRLDSEAARRGVADRVRTVEADLDAAWPALEPVDLVWASSSLHHVADPDHALAQVHRVLRADGLLAVTEMDGLPRFLPDDLGLGRPGLGQRCHDALAAQHAEHVPHQGSDWGARLAGAGFAVQPQRTFVVDLHAPLPDGAVRYAEISLRGLRARLDGQLDSDDLAVLDTLLGDGPQSLAHRTDLVIRTTRSGWLARRR